ncbi:MAG TPA: hypothetical protein VGO39_08170, partial [Gaiellaceae bacterium]|nr:hypothetical protein [Gaiellaceae bacterium]
MDGTYSRWSRANRAPNTLLRNTLLRNMLLGNMLLRWYRQLFLAGGRNRRSTAVPARGSQPASVTATLEETTVPLDQSRGFGSTEPVEPAAMLSEEPLDGHGEEDVVNAWRAEQLQLLG